MSIIAIITARGGSKRIPHKNIKEFCGKPIISYSIESALQSSIFDDVIVSTDSIDIAEISKRFGASVPFLRSNKSSGDYATTSDVIEEVLSEQEKRGIVYDTVCCIYPTAPFVTSEKLRNAFHLLNSTEVESVLPVVRFSYPPQRAFILRDHYLFYKYPEYEKSRSQDLEAMYHDCGQFYFCYVEAFKKYHSLITPKTGYIVMPEDEVQDIDNLSDWELAELKYQAFIKRIDK